MSEEESDILLPIALFHFLLLITTVYGNTLESDKQVLLSFKTFLENQNPINKGYRHTKWDSSDSSPCNWRGITCDEGFDRVTRIDLSHENLSGKMFNNFSAMTELTYIDLSMNTIGGYIPTDLGQCKNLRFLNLSHNIIDDCRVMAEDKRVEYAIQRELQFKQKIANLFPDNDAPLEVKRWKALISKRNRSTDGRTDCSQTTTTCKYNNVSHETFETDEEINARGTISRSNSNVKRRKALISKNKISAGGIIDRSATTCIHTELSQETLKHLESDGQTLLPNRFPCITSPPHPSLSPTYTYSRRKKNAESSNSGFVSPQQQQYTPNIMHYCKDCEVYCSGDLCYEQHLRGNKHKVKLQCRGDSSVKGKNKQVIRCDLCEIYCQDETSLEMHLKGQKHKAKQHEMEHGKKIKDENAQLLWCELCQIPCMNEDNFTLHLKGKKHQRQLYVLEEKKKAEAQGLRHA